MKKLILLSSFGGLLTISCSNGAPKCSDTEVRLLVMELSKEQYGENGFPSVSNIRLNDKDNDLRKCECEAEVVFTNGNRYDVTYTAQYTEDGKVYVELWGIK